jgi:hypothetical protein
MFKIEGLENMSKHLDQVSEAFGENEGVLGELRFDPNDPASIESAIQESERIIDERVAAYPNNPLLESIGEQMKERYRAGIVERAAAARLEGAAENENN